METNLIIDFFLKIKIMKIKLNVVLVVSFKAFVLCFYIKLIFKFLKLNE